MVDRNGLHFTKNRRYTVKSGYQLERVYPNKEKPPDVFGPTIDLLKAFWFEYAVPSKNKTFLMEIGVRVYRQLRKIYRSGEYKETYVVPDVGLQRIDKPCVL